MKRLYIMIASVLLASCAHMQSVVASDGRNSVRLTDQPCVDAAVLKHLNPKYRDVVQEASAVIDGHQYAACWMVDRDQAHLLFDDGEQALIPRSSFRRDEGA